MFAIFSETGSPAKAQRAQDNHLQLSGQAGSGFLRFGPNTLFESSSGFGVFFFAYLPHGRAMISALARLFFFECRAIERREKVYHAKLVRMQATAIASEKVKHYRRRVIDP